MNWMFIVLKRFSSYEDEMVRYNIWLNGLIIFYLKICGNLKKIFWIYDFWKSLIKSLSKILLILLFILFILLIVVVYV